MNNQNRPLIWAHRGASGEAPENTMEAFRLALLQGADGIELDVQLSKDGVPVVIHDEWIDRTSTGSGWVRDMALEELRAFSYNVQFPEAYGPCQIPTLSEVLELFSGTDKWINIELKTGIIAYEGLEEICADLVRRYEMTQQVVFSSFRHESVLKMHALLPGVMTGFLYSDGFLEVPPYASRHGVDALHPALFHLMTPGFVEECHQRGLRVHVWTVNEEEHIRLAAGAGVDAIITNFPERAGRLLNEEKEDSIRAAFSGAGEEYSQLDDGQTSQTAPIAGDKTPQTTAGKIRPYEAVKSETSLYESALSEENAREIDGPMAAVGESDDMVLDMFSASLDQIEFETAHSEGASDIPTAKSYDIHHVIQKAGNQVTEKRTLGRPWYAERYEIPVSVNGTDRYPCPCCGYLTYTVKPGRTFRICPVCFWEDDPESYADQEYQGGPLPVSLKQARGAMKLLGVADPSMISFARRPLPEEIPPEVPEEAVLACEEEENEEEG